MTTNSLSSLWRRSGTHTDEKEPSSPLPPMVSASQSDETLCSSPSLKIPFRPTPSTPDGLKPRKLSVKSVRPALGGYSLPPLPPRQALPWATEQPLYSPPVSTSSFYARGLDEDQDVAQSPRLLPGHARTAVGAVVAMGEAFRDLRESKRVAPPNDGNKSHGLHDSSIMDENDEPRYFSLENDPVANSRTPMRMAHTTGPLPDSPISHSSSYLAGSPSSRVYKRDASSMQKKLMDASFSSQTELIKPAVAKRYDFAPISDHVVDTSLEFVPKGKYESVESHPPLDASLQRRKRANQLYSKEELLILIASRLRDDLSLVKEIDKIGCIGNDDWFLKTHLDQEGILTGYKEEHRFRILDRIGSILNEMKIAQPEDLFHSPSAAPKFTETHNDLRSSLLFCRSMMVQAVPVTERTSVGFWHCQADVRSSLGIVPIESPERCATVSHVDVGETPMTSNVSVGTSITSTVTPPRRSAKESNVNGLLVRRTIEVYTTLLQKLTQCCTKLRAGGNGWTLSVEDSIRVTETMKRTYFQLMAMEISDLNALLNSFRYDLHTDGNFKFPQCPALLDSDDDDAESIPPSPPRNEGLFSPTAEEILAIEDDLKRTVESGDYALLEERDGPPSEVIDVD